MKIGKIISVSELGVEILTDGAEVRYRDMLYTELNGKHYRFEVQAVEGSIVNAISFESCAGLKRGLECDAPVGEICAKALDKGLLLLTAGTNVIRFVPPLVIKEEHVDQMAEILTEVLKEFE